MATCPSITSKVILTVIGVIFWGAAAGLIFVGAWVYHTYNNYSHLTKDNLTLIPAGIVITVGVFLFILGCIGCLAAVKEHKCVLAVFFFILLVVLVAEVTAGVLGYVYRVDVKSAVKDGLTEAVQKYQGGPGSDEQVDYLQTELQCCGIMNASDWLNGTEWSKSKIHAGLVPQSCCIKFNCTATILAKEIYMDGCYDKLQQQFLSKLVYIASIAIAFAVLQLLGMICSCILMCRSQEIRYETLGGPNSGLRV
ncbi:hypothetical protein ACJMK2_044352 [Sinanodonta woodiana]|uniref:Tetraspanin n=1 Tax=Sinanodonta woodiana TaxID=1069815 RepID=A0ABD3W1N7_SINWO